MPSTSLDNRNSDRRICPSDTKAATFSRRRDKKRMHPPMHHFFRLVITSDVYFVNMRSAPLSKETECPVYVKNSLRDNPAINDSRFSILYVLAMVIFKENNADIMMREITWPICTNTASISPLRSLTKGKPLLAWAILTADSYLWETVLFRIVTMMQV